MTFSEILEEIGIDTMGYSGRGCYGRECLAVTDYDSSSEFWSAVIDGVQSAYKGKDLVSCLQVVSAAMKDLSEDSLGRGSVLYWQGITFKK